MGLLRFVTAGSVDDGKSTLIGRLLYDTKSVLDDQLMEVERASRRTGQDEVNLALLTDGLRAEREQGITIDVAHRYFATPRRKFIIADAPGHVQYTRNMVTAASTADLAVVLVDARHGLTEQSHRHIFLLSLLRVPHMVLAVNKMDLVDYDQAVYERIREEFTASATRLSVPDLVAIPMSALHGDNIVAGPQNMPWYDGNTLLHHLENVYVASDHNLVDARFAVQCVLRARSTNSGREDRGYAGRMLGGILRVGDEVMMLPGELSSTVTAIDSPAGPVTEAFPPMSVTVRLADDVDVARGHVLCRPNNRPTARTELDALVCWMDTEPVRAGQRLLLKHPSHATVPAIVRELAYQIDVNTLHRHPTDRLELNGIGRMLLRLGAPVVVDDYQRNRNMGSFILVDPRSNRTAGGGVISGTHT